MDSRVQEVQQWLGDTFPQYFRYDEDGNNSGSFPVKPDGLTGNTTVKALIMALQIHKNLTPDGAWGSQTTAAYPCIDKSIVDTITIKIVQGAFLCKGYNPGSFDGVFGDKTAKAIKEFKADLGMTSDEKLESDYFKALLTTDPSVLIGIGNIQIRSVQQYLNREYSSLFINKLGFLPTGGLFERKTSKALIYAIQSEVKTTPDGMLGPKTFSLFPSIETGCTNTKIVFILKALLICHGYVLNFDGVYDTDLSIVVRVFQEFMCLDKDPSVTLGKVNRRTWGALLWSCGDTDRSPNACDCRTKILDSALAYALYNMGIRYIGRYLTNVANGYDKKMTSEEVQILLKAGLKIFPIFQESPNSTVLPTDFDFWRGQDDAKKAIKAALNLGITKDTVIYFALDCDMMEDEINNYAIPYFEGIKEIFDFYDKCYKIGVYGTRNSCNKVCNAGYAVNSFVADMSSGYSGNLGYLMPQTWAFEQYIEYRNYTIAGHTLDIDFDMASDFDSGISSVSELSYNLDLYRPPYFPEKEEVEKLKSILDLIPAIHWLEETYYSYHGIQQPDVLQGQQCFKSVLDYLYQYQYNDLKFTLVSPVDHVFINYINTQYKDHQYVKELYPYIYATEEGDGNEKMVTRAKLVTDGKLGIFELPHLAVVIKCYIPLFFPDDYTAWAGDFATAVKEVYANCQEQVEQYVPFAIERIGAMENDTVSVTEARMFNYCDLIADLDGYKIQNMMQNSLSIYALSECMQNYYSDEQYYYKRYQYFKSLIKFSNWNEYVIKKAILPHFILPLKVVFANEADNYPGSDEAAAIALSLNIMYWARYTTVI